MCEGEDWINERGAGWLGVSFLPLLTFFFFLVHIVYPLDYEKEEEYR